AVSVSRGTERLPIQMHGHEDRNRIDLRADASVIQIERVIRSFNHGNIDVHPLDRLITSVVDGVGVSRPADSASGSLQNRCAAIDGELSFAVEDDEHFLAVVVKVGSDSTLRFDNSPVKKKQIRVQAMKIEQRHVV